MNKNIKKLIAITLIVGAFTGISPVTNLNLMTTKAYADTSDGVTSLKVKTSSGSSLAIYDDNDYESGHKVNDDEVKNDKTYYAKTSSSSIKISISGVSSDNVRVFDGTSSTTKGDRVGSSISLSETTTVIVRVYSTNPGSVKYNNKTDMISEYRIKVKYTGSEDNGEQSNVYLDNISLSSGDISFLKKTTTYNVDVEEDIDEIEIGARPDCDSSEYDDYKVRIGGTKVDKDDKFKETISLSKGKNSIEITVEDDKDNMKTYILNVTRGEVNATINTNTATDSNNVSTSTKNDQLVQVNVNAIAGWLSYGGSWYYIGTDGAKKIGWQEVNGAWYYLDTTEGKMKIGWMKDVNGKYYYLNNNGSMAYNTTIDQYVLGADGAWVG